MLRRSASSYTMYLQNRDVNCQHASGSLSREQTAAAPTVQVSFPEAVAPAATAAPPGTHLSAWLIPRHRSLVLLLSFV